MTAPYLASTESESKVEQSGQSVTNHSSVFELRDGQVVTQNQDDLLLAQHKQHIYKDFVKIDSALASILANLKKPSN